MNLKLRLFISILTLLGLTACAAPRFEAGTPLAKSLDLIKAVNTTIEAGGCRNAAYYQIPGYPYLRTTRFWQSLAPKEMSREQFGFWLDTLRSHDRQARQGELSCLDTQQRLSLLTSVGKVHGIRNLEELVEASAMALVNQNRRQRDSVLTDMAAVKVPDDYSLGLRIFGVYPISRLPILYGVYNAYDERHEWFRQDVSSLVDLEKVSDIGPATASLLTSSEIRAILDMATDNLLAVPLPNEEHALQLIEHFAPRFRQEVKLAADHWGRVNSANDGIKIMSERVAYYYLDHQILDGQALLRLNYVIWHPARAGDNVPWFERGNLEGVTYAITLDPTGEPLIASTMNNCGCYLQFYPVSSRISGVVDKPFNPDVLVPQEMPTLDQDERIAVTMNSGWHQVVRLEANNLAPDATYHLEHYSALEQLPHPSGRTRNLFDSDGILPDTERAERFFFYGMGIPSVGSMRQRGHQPTTLLGREHYDDPDLIEKNFIFADGMQE